MLNPLSHIHTCRYNHSYAVVTFVKYECGMAQVNNASMVRTEQIKERMEQNNLTNPIMHLSHIQQYTTLEQKCAHFCSKVVYCAIWDRCIVGFVRLIYWFSILQHRLGKWQFTGCAK